MKKLSLLMAVVILLSSVFAVSAFAEEDEEWTNIDGVNFAYRIIDNKYAAITVGSDFIPEQIDGYPVTIIEDHAFTFSNKSNKVRDWVIPETVTYIGERAFMENKALGTVKIPSSVTYIGESAFANCYNLTKINIPQSVRKIKPYTFFECKKLNKITLHDTIKKIGDYAFFGCRALSEFKVPTGLYTIGKRAFYLCPSLKSINFSGSDPDLGYQSFGFYNTYSGDKGKYYPGKTIPDKTTKKYKNFKIITDDTRGDYDDGPAGYAEKNNFKYLVSFSRWDRIGEGGPGESRTLYLENEILKDYKTSNPKVIKLTPDGKLTTLQEGKATVEVTLPDGKIYRGVFEVYSDPVIWKKATSGKYKGRYVDAKSVSVKKGKTVSVKIFGKAKSIDNKYTSTSKAQIVSKKSATTIKIKGKAKGTSTVKIKVNGVKTLSIKVKVT